MTGAFSDWSHLNKKTHQKTHQKTPQNIVFLKSQILISTYTIEMEHQALVTLGPGRGAFFGVKFSFQDLLSPISEKSNWFFYYQRVIITSCF